MADQFTTLTLTTLPTTRADGTALGPNDLGGANVYKNGAKYATLHAPLAVGATFVDSVAAVGGESYFVTVFDTQTPAVESSPSNTYVATLVVVVPPLAAPGAPGISGVTA